MKDPKRLFVLAAALLFMLPTSAYPSIAGRLFQWREPTFLVPLRVRGNIQIREDPYGSGSFGAPRNGGRRHRGVDLVAPVGTPVLAAKSGRAMIGRIRNGMGRYVEVRHPDGWVSRYGHLRRIAIRDRQRVHRGDILGTVGKSGNARRRIIQSHLHFEVINARGTPVNPLEVMEAAKGDEP